MVPVCSHSHYNVEVCGRQMGKREKKNTSNLVKGDGTGDTKEERNNL